jgi:exodeoxyribonuclease V gamma subunit
VEVLRDAIAHLLCDDPTLEPRDVVVMCPDIDTFAPLIHATFGAAAQITHRDLHVRLADRSIRQTNPLLGSISRLLDMASGRVQASEVLDLADTPAVRRRFGFDDDELSRIAEWSRDSGVRWGLDAASRSPFKMTAIGEGTWRSGLDRLMLGVAMSEDGLRRFGDALPLDDVDSADVDLAGRLAELIDRLATVLAALRAAGPLEQWLNTLSDAVDLLAATTDSEQWQRLQFDEIIDDVRREAGPTQTELTLTEVRGLFADRLRGVRPRPTSAPAISPCAPWFPCDRYRTGWCACSVWTTGCSPATANRTATTSSPARRSWATPIREARTDSSSSTRCWPPRTTW